MGNLDLDVKIRILDLQLNAKSETGFQRWDHAEIYVFGFSFYRLIGKSEKGFEELLKNSSLARSCIISKKKTAFHENSFANPRIS